MRAKAETYQAVWKDLQETWGQGAWEAEEVKKMLHCNMTTIHWLKRDRVIEVRENKNTWEMYLPLEQVLRAAIAYSAWCRMGVYGDDVEEGWREMVGEVGELMTREGNAEFFADRRVQEAIVLVARGVDRGE